MADDDPAAAALAIVLALAECDPTAYDTARGQGIRCALCNASPPGAARTLLQGQHQQSCPWRQACQLSDAMTGWNRPPGG
jgi:hypothetical protein